MQRILVVNAAPGDRFRSHLAGIWRKMALTNATAGPIGRRAGMDIEAWLRGLGLEQYAPAFRDNDIDAEVLPRLTPEDLTAIGILSVGIAENFSMP